MPITVYVPTQFRRLVNNKTFVEVSGDTVGEALDKIGSSYPEINRVIFDQNHSIPTHINVYLNNQEIHTLQGRDTKIADGSWDTTRSIRKPPGPKCPVAQ